MSYFDMRGRRFPLWTSEPGVGRDKTTEITFKADVDWKVRRRLLEHQLSAADLSCPLGATRCMSRRLPIRHSISGKQDFHEIEVWAVPERIELTARPTFVALVEALSERFGRQPPLPEWVCDGAIIGLKDGARSFERLEDIIARRREGVGAVVRGLGRPSPYLIRRAPVLGLAGQRRSLSRAPRSGSSDSRNAASASSATSIPISPSTARCSARRKSAGYFATDGAGNTALVDFGEFDCGVVDFTNPEAADWFAERVIGQNMLDFGLSGWMADFGEYLPIDVELSNGVGADADAQCLADACGPR